MSDSRDNKAVTRQVVCVHCGAEVFWGLPRPEDPCIECGKPINRQDDEAILAEALQQKRADILVLVAGMPDEVSARYLEKSDAQIAALASMSLRLQIAEEIANRAVEQLIDIYEQDGPLPEGHWLLEDRAALASSAEQKEVTDV